MIRILQVVNAADRGGAETMIMNVYRMIDRSEIQFDFTNHKKCKAAYDDEITSLGGRILYLPKFKGYNYLQYVCAYRKLFSEHPEYQIVHVHNYNIAGIVNKVAREMGVKVRITHSHSTRLNLSWLKRVGFRFFRKSMLKNSTHLFSCGINAGKFMFGHHSFTIVPNAIDTSKFHYDKVTRLKLRTMLGLSTSTTIYGHVGSFRTPKNHSFLIDIFAEIHKHAENTILVLIGNGNLLQAAKEKVKNLGLEKYVLFLGLQSNVHEWLSAFDVFIMPSLWEGFPVSVVEAQCAGLPCIISDVIDRNVDLTNHVTFLPLKSSLSKWADTCQTLPPTNREYMGKLVDASVYNIHTTTANLTKTYKELALFSTMCE